MKEKFTDSNGVVIQYLVENYSPGEIPLVIIPGAVVGAEDIYNDIKDFLDLYCIIISIRGRGKSASPLQGYTKDDQVSDIEAVLNNEGLDRIFLLGHSFGASLAAYYSIKNPEKISGLILADFPPEYPGYSPEWAQYIKNNLSGVDDNFLSGMVRDGVYEDFTDELAKCDFKKLFLKGSGSDSLLKPGKAEDLISRIPTASLKVINGAGHELFNEKPGETLQVIEEFIKTYEY